MNNPKEAKSLKAFGKRFAEIRRSRGYTQETLAEKANITALSLAYIEQGRRWPRLITIQKLAECMDVPVIELFRGL